MYTVLAAIATGGEAHPPPARGRLPRERRRGQEGPAGGPQVAHVDAPPHQRLLVEAHPGDDAGHVAADLHPQIQRPPGARHRGRDVGVGPECVGGGRGGGRAGGCRRRVAVGRDERPQDGPDPVAVGGAGCQAVILEGGGARRGGPHLRQPVKPPVLRSIEYPLAPTDADHDSRTCPGARPSRRARRGRAGPAGPSLRR